MAVSNKHNKTSSKTDSADTSLVLPSDWNAEHTVTLTGPAVIGKATSGNGAATEVTINDDDTMAAASSTTLSTDEAIKAYVDSTATAADLDFQGDSGGALAIDLDSETLTLAGGSGITSVGATNTVTFNIDASNTTQTSLANLVTVGALNSGSITAGFGAIDIGASDFTTGGQFIIDVDGSSGSAGRAVFGASADAEIFYTSANVLHLRTNTAGSSINFNAEGDSVTFQMSDVTSATFDTGGLNLVSGDAYSINATSVLNATTLGSAVVNSSLTTVGALNAGSITSGFGSVDTGSSTITTTGDITGGGIHVTGDTAAGDNAALGYTATEGLILTGQGSTNDLTVKNDADTTVIAIPTGGTEVDLTGTLDIIHTATANDEHALELEVDAAGFGDVKAIDIDYITGAVAAGEEEAVILSNIDQISATGGTIVGHEVLATDGSADAIYAQKAGAGVGPIEQASGSFANPTTGTNNTTSTDVAAMIDGSTGTNTTIFVADNDYILIGAAAAFTEIEFIIQTGAANPGIKPTFGYSISGSHQFTTFSPIDGTNGFRNTGVVAWDAADLTSHTTNDDTSTFDIKITRTHASAGSVSLYYAKTAATTTYKWDKDGVVSISSIELGHATDTTLARVSAGVVSIEGTNIAMSGGAFHDGFSDFVANEHIDWTSTSSNFSTSGTAATGVLTTTGQMNGSAALNLGTNQIILNPASSSVTNIGTSGTPIEKFQVNTESGGQGFELTAAGASYIQMYNSSGGTDEKYWRYGHGSGGILEYQTVNDAYSSAATIMILGRDADVGIGGMTGSLAATLHVSQLSTSGAKPVLILDQDDIDDTFIDFQGTSAADGSRSISSDTTEDSAKFGAVRVEINGTTKWIRIYDDES